MTLLEMIQRYPREPASGVPDWMLGCFRRRCISFANGESDEHTIVYWLQTRNLTIDLRLPRTEQQVRAAPIGEYNEQELTAMANYEGWLADCAWNGKEMAWQRAESLQVTNRWPEPAVLHRIGNSMIEFAPSGAYVEDWRMQASAPGPLLGLRLLQEFDAVTNSWAPRGGGLIVCGDYAALVVGRPATSAIDAAKPLQDQVRGAVGNEARLHELLGFETSIAVGSLQEGYTVMHSTVPERQGAPLFGPGTFEWNRSESLLEHRVLHEGQECRRRYAVDVMLPHQAFPLSTPCDATASDWFIRESGTLRRYAEVLS
jgi:hypothetical protein|tara:strand:- start:39486 stop:40430 length:945 start_codon:yes stop_codon:yes gene_type:complete